MTAYRRCSLRNFHHSHACPWTWDSHRTLTKPSHDASSGGTLLGLTAVQLFQFRLFSLLPLFSGSSRPSTSPQFQIKITQLAIDDNMNSIGGLVVKLAVAMRDFISNDSASPGFDSRPMHHMHCSTMSVSLLLFGTPAR